MFWSLISVSRKVYLSRYYHCLQLKQVKVLEMSSKGKIDSYFSPKPRIAEAKRQRNSSSTEPPSGEIGAKRSKQDLDEKVNAEKSPQNGGKDQVQLSPEQTERIDKNRLIALEKLQEKSISMMGETWKAALAPEFKKEYFIKLKKFVDSQRKQKTIYPPEKDVFSWTQFCSVEKIKVVIIGQDPYHGPNQAHGLSFSVPVKVQVPPSLQNIYKELKTDIDGFEIPKHGYLIGWAKQGVLLLNAVLTVEAHNANSHQGKGWEHFTDAVIKWINRNSENVVFLLWGAYAQKKGASIDKKRHCVLKGPHPSPLSARRGFFGCQHFSKANSYLEAKGKSPIDWKYLPENL